MNMYIDLGKIHLLSVEIGWYDMCAAPFQMQTVSVIFHCFVLFSLARSVHFSHLHWNFCALFYPKSKMIGFVRANSISVDWQVSFITSCKWEHRIPNDSFLFSCIDHLDFCGALSHGRSEKFIFDCQKVSFLFVSVRKINDDWTKWNNKSKSTVLIVCWVCLCACEYLLPLNRIELNWIYFTLVVAVCIAVVVVILSRDL